MAYLSKPGQTVGKHIAALMAIEDQKIRKATENLLGICAGIIADDTINASEITYLQNWLLNHPEVADDWPGCIIAQRVRSILDDGIVTAAESFDLLETLKQLSGNRMPETGTASADFPALPIDDDPSIFFDGMTYCLTGRFLFGPRSRCERTILDLGGTVIDTVTKRLDFLVIGAMVEPSWAHTTYGRKIQKAVEYRDIGAEITVISEQQWNSALEDASR